MKKPTLIVLFGKYILTLGDALPFPKEGIKLSSLDMFINECGGRSALKGLTTTDVNNKHVKPLTSYMESSYCDYLKLTNPDNVWDAQVFISHAWQYVFLDVVDTLQTHFKSNPDIIIWFDLFSNNQHKAIEFDFDWWSTTFKSAIEQFHHTVLIWSPWNNPIPLTRAWCLFEIYCTAEYNCRFEITLSLADQERFVESIQNDTVGSINAMLATIDARNSSAFKEDDKDRIFHAVKRTVGFKGINGLVFGRLRDWVIDTVTKSLQEAPTGKERAAHQLSLGLLYMNQGRYKLAKNCLKDSLNVRENILEIGHPDSLKSMRSLASLYQSMGRYDKALPLYTICFQIRQKKLGENHLDTLESMNDLASLYQTTGRCHDAFELYTKCLTMRKAILGEEHPDTLVSMNDMASLCHCTGCYHDPLPLFTECLEMRQKKLGLKHPDTLVSMKGLASLYQSMGRNEQAFHLYTKYLARREEVLGEEHPDAIITSNDINKNVDRDDDTLRLKYKCTSLKAVAQIEKCTTCRK